MIGGVAKKFVYHREDAAKITRSSVRASAQLSTLDVMHLIKCTRPPPFFCVCYQKWNEATHKAHGEQQNMIDVKIWGV